MGRAATALVVGIVAAVLAVGVVDSFRGGGDEAPRKRPPGEAARALAAGVESRAAIANRLRHEGIAGRLVYTDERCTLHAVSLPDLVPAPAPRSRHTGCSFSAAPDGERTGTPGAGWSPDSRRVAVCRATGVYVTVGSERGALVDRYVGCTPAWRPDGVLTLVRDGEVVEAGGALIVSADSIREAARRHLVAPDPPQLEIAYDVVDLAWATSTRVAVLLRLGFSSAGRSFEPEYQVAVFEGGSIVGTQDGLGGPWVRLDAGRGLIAARPGFLLDARARRLYPQIGGGTGRVDADAVAVSPDGLWAAVALRGRVTLLSIRALRAGRFRSVTLPFAAGDLAWR